MKHTYSFGLDSPLKIRITKKQALSYNKVTKAFFDYQLAFKEIEGRPWTADYPFSLAGTTKKDTDTYNYVGSLINMAIYHFPRDLFDEDLPHDYLVRN